MVVHLIRRVKRKRTEIAAVMTDWSLPNVEIEVRVKKKGAEDIRALACWNASISGHADQRARESWSLFFPANY
jgi:hypothetical protein